MGPERSGSRCVVFDYYFAFVVQVAFEYVRLVTNVDFTRCSIERQRLCGQFIVSSTLVPAGA